jgi:hypothetical protein
MQRLNVRVDWQRAAIPLIIVAACALALGLGMAMAQFGFGVREVVILSLGVMGVALAVMSNERALRVGFSLWLFTFALGWRTLYLTSVLNIHPIEVMGYLLLFLVILQSIVWRKPLDLHIPKLLLLLLAFAFIGILTGLARGAPLDNMLQEFKNFVVLIPIYYLVQWFIRDRRDFERTANILIIVATYIAGLGFIDFFLPGLSRSIANDPSTNPIFIADSYAGNTFARVGFIFFGNFSAGFVIFAFFGFTIHHFLRAYGKERNQTVLFGALAAIQLFAMYLSGFRGLWYAVIAFAVAYSLVRARALILLALGFAALPFLPENFFRRLVSVFVSSEADSSQLGRIERAQGALDAFYQSPLFGVGLSGSGYVHSDLIQIAANLGVFAILTLAAWWGDLMLKVLRLQRRRDWNGDYAAAMFAMLVGNLVVLAGEGTLTFLQLIAPIWLMCVLVYKLHALTAEAEAVALPLQTSIGQTPLVKR